MKINWKILFLSIFLSLLITVPLTNHLLISYSNGIDAHNNFLEDHNLTEFQEKREKDDLLIFLLIIIGFIFFGMCVFGDYITQ